MIWQTARFQIDLSRPLVMGIVNVTPDSFSDGGKYYSSGENFSGVLAHCEQLIREGADLLDIGGESTRPGASPVPLEQELARVLAEPAAAAKQPPYYDIVLSLFGMGWSDRQYRFSRAGELSPSWTSECKTSTS